MTSTNAALILLTGAGVALGACTPFPLVRSIASSNPGCLYYAEPAGKVVALTIDDGPDPATTPRILDLLREHRSRATFFLISSRVAGNDSVVMRTLREGHEVGNHMSRNEASISLSPARFERSLLEADSVLRRFATLRWARPGSGFYDARMVSTMRRHKYMCALGSVYPFDPQIPLVGYATRTILGGVRKGSVIVLHDGGYKGRNTVRVLSRLLPELRRRGYSVVTLSELVEASGGRDISPDSILPSLQITDSQPHARRLSF
jgi:peptidoglycan/xylan/chitin deacetylase (PgdA/CDA1 family)